MPVTKVSSLQTRAREPLSIYRTHHYAMPCRISLHYCALLFKYFFTPKLQIHLAANQVIVLWRLDPWLIDYGGVSWFAFKMWTITSLASLSKCKYDWEPASIQIMRPDAPRSKSFDNCRGWSWRGRDCFPNYSIVRVCDHHSSMSTLLYYISLLSGYRFSMQTPNMNWTMTKIVELGNKLIISDPSPLG